MSSYPDARSKSRRPFITTAYRPDAEGVLHPELPSRCPFSSSDEPTPCVLGLHHVRERKTGPCFGLAVLACSVHRRSFTLYPPGFAPYQRSAVVRLSWDGSPVVEALDEEASAEEDLEERRLRREFRDTFFEAALDASRGESWARDSLAEVPDRWWSTQCRSLDFCRDLLGLGPEMEEHQRELIASVLRVDLISLREHAQELRDREGYVEIGVAIRRVLLGLRGGVRQALRFLFCGHVIGQWGRPIWWSGSGKMIDLPFPSPGTS